MLKTLKKYILPLIVALSLSATCAHATEKNYKYKSLDSIDSNLSAMVGQMIICGFKGQDISQDPTMLKALQEGKVGGVILFYRHKDIIDYNISSPSQVKTLINNINSLSPYPLFISIDQEGGMVQRISSKNGFKDYPSAYELGLGSLENTYISSKILAEDLKELGFNLNFAPSVDIHNPKSPAIGKYERAFSANPEIVTKYAKIFIKGMKSQNIIPTIKHFPGHGNATTDTHDGFTDITNTWKEEELLPYKEIIKDNFTGIIMTAHVFHKDYDDKPATLSYNIITKLLREQLGFSGVVTTDDMQMGALTNNYTLEETVLHSINAGVDILLFGNNLEYDPNLALKLHDTVMKLVEEGKISEERIAQSWARIKKLKQSYLLSSSK